MRALALPLLLTACGGGFEIDGTPGTPVPARFDSLLPYATVRISGGPARRLICDSGSPFTILDSSQFVGLGDGKHEVDLQAFGLTFREAGVVAWDLPGQNLASGLFGADLLGNFAFTLDYKAERLWVTDPYQPRGDVEVGPEVALSVALRGGGKSGLPGCGGHGCGTVTFPPTRFMVKARFEDLPEVWVIIDTGSSGIFLDAATFGELHGARPRLDGALVATVEGDEPAFLSRVWRATLVGVDGAASVALDDVPVLVAPGDGLLASLSAEAGVDARALVGGHFLRASVATLDYPARKLRLAPYLDPSHIDPEEFVGVGFTYQREAGGLDWRIVESFTNGDAYAKGVRPGDVLEEIDGMPVRGQSVEVLDAALARFHLGQTVPVTIRNVGGMAAVDVKVEDLLPHLAPPS